METAFFRMEADNDDSVDLTEQDVGSPERHIGLDVASCAFCAIGWKKKFNGCPTDSW